MRDDELACILALAVVDVDHEVAHLARNEEVFAHRDLHIGSGAADEADLLAEGHHHIELWVVDDGAHGADMDALPVADLRLAPSVVDERGIDGHQLCLEEPAELGADFSPALSEVEGLGHVRGDLEGERHLGVANGAAVVREARNELSLVPCAHLRLVLVSLTLVSMVDLLTHVDELELELDAICRNCLLAVNVDLPSNRMVGIKSALIALKIYGEASAFKS